MGANPQVVSVLRDGYSLPFSQRPLLTRFSLIHSGYANPTKSRFLKEALLTLIGKLVVEKVVIKSSLAFYNRLFLVPKLNRKWRPILDLSQLNLYLKTISFKMETLETIRLSLQTGEWVTSLDFSDAYFNQPKVKKVSEILPQQPDFPIHSSPLWFGHSSPRVYKGGQRSEANGSGQGYLNPPIPRRLVAESPVPGNHNEILLALCQQLGWVRPCIRSGPSHSGLVDSSPGKIKFHQEPEQLHSQTVYVPDRAAYSHREASLVGTSSYEANSMAFETSLACPPKF